MSKQIASKPRLASKESEASSVAQRDELEALSSIFGNDLKLEKPIWGNASFSVLIRLLGQDSVGASLNQMCVELGVIYTAKYPRQPPSIDVRKPRSLPNATSPIPEAEMKTLKTTLVKEAERLSESNQGDPYLFEIIRIAQDFLAEKIRKTRTVTDSVAESKGIDNADVSNKNLHSPTATTAQMEDLEMEARARKREAWLQEQQQADPTHKSATTFAVERKAETTLQTTKADEVKMTTKKSGRYYSDYEDLGAVGRGGFGHVYKARNRLDGMIYAVKKIRLDGDELQNRKTRNEATTLAKLVHPNIVRYFAAWLEEDEDASESESEGDEFDEFSESEPSILRPSSSFTGFLSRDDDDDDDESSGGFEWDEASEEDEGNAESSNSRDRMSSSKKGKRFAKDKQGSARHSGVVEQPKKQTLYIVMEFVPRTVRALIDSKELIGNDNRCFELVREILDALSCVHDLHIIHQDIKPENLLIDEQGRVKLGDFGLAVQQEADDRDSAEVGTTYYRAPEVGKGQWDEKCDVYSLGVVLVEMFCPPTETNMERHKMLTNLRLEPPVLPDKLKNEDAAKLARQMLQKDPARRPSASQALKAIPGHVLVEHAVDTVIKTLAPGSTAFTRLLKHLFSQTTSHEVDAAFDYDPASSEALANDEAEVMLKQAARSLSELSAVNALPIPESLVPVNREIAVAHIENAAVSAFERMGAIRFRAPLFSPSREDQLLASSSKRAASFLDPMGVCVALPHMSSTRSFARFVGQNRAIRHLKRYDLASTYSRTGGGGQPLTQKQICLDTVAAIHDLEAEGCRNAMIEQIDVLKEILTTGTKLVTNGISGITVEIGHAQFLPTLFQAARVPPEAYQPILQAIRKHEFFRDWKQAVDVLTAEAKCPVGAAQALKFCLPIGKRVWVSGSSGEILPPIATPQTKPQNADSAGFPPMPLLSLDPAKPQSSGDTEDETQAHHTEDSLKRRGGEHGRKKSGAGKSTTGNVSHASSSTTQSGSSKESNNPSPKLHLVETLIEQAISAKMGKCADLLKEMWGMCTGLMAICGLVRVRLVIWSESPPDVTGLFFRVMIRRRRAVVRANRGGSNRQGAMVYEEGNEFLAGDGGRFDGLISAYAHPQSRGGASAAAGGAATMTSSTGRGEMFGCTARLYVDRIAKLRVHHSTDSLRKRALVLFCWPVEKDALKFGCDDRSRSANRLRSELPGIGVEWIHPKNLSGDALLALCKETGCRVMISKTPGDMISAGSSSTLAQSTGTSTGSLLGGQSSQTATVPECYRVRGWAFPSGIDASSHVVEAYLHTGIFTDKRCDNWSDLVRVVSQMLGIGKVL